MKPVPQRRHSHRQSHPERQSQAGDGQAGSHDTTLPLPRSTPGEPDSKGGGGEAKSAGHTLLLQALDAQPGVPWTWGGGVDRRFKLTVKLS